MATNGRLVADLRGNLVGDNGERELARAVGELPKLERLDLRLGGNCRSSGAGPLHHELKNAAASSAKSICMLFFCICRWLVSPALLLDLRCESCKLVAAFVNFHTESCQAASLSQIQKVEIHSKTHELMARF